MPDRIIEFLISCNTKQQCTFFGFLCEVKTVILYYGRLHRNIPTNDRYQDAVLEIAREKEREGEGERERGREGESVCMCNRVHK